MKPSRFYIILLCFVLITCQISDNEEIINQDDNPVNIGGNVFINYYENGNMKTYLYFSDSSDCWTQGVFFREDGMIKEAVFNQECALNKDSSSEYFDMMEYFNDFVWVDSLGNIENFLIRSSSRPTDN